MKILEGQVEIVYILIISIQYTTREGKREEKSSIYAFKNKELEETAMPVLARLLAEIVSNSGRVEDTTTNSTIQEFELEETVGSHVYVSYAIPDNEYGKQKVHIISVRSHIEDARQDMHDYIAETQPKKPYEFNVLTLNVIEQYLNIIK